MCGICGFISVNDRNANDVAAAMANAMQHRGPDQNGLWRNERNSIAFGHTRLSIIDLSELGRQPMSDDASGITLTFNGEIYNYRDLRKSLVNLGHSFKSNSDTEVILRGYLEWGEAVVPKLRGMFAFALWDPKTQETLLVRDRLGIKPIYFANTTHGFLFASEVRALMATGLIDSHLDPDGLASYLWHGFVPGPRTIVANIQRLDPATLLRLDSSGNVLGSRQYWQLDPVHNKLPEPDAYANCKDQLDRAIEEHLVSDVSLGVFLSGGVDSSVIATIAQRMAARSIATYNIRFEEESFDESKYAQQIARQIGSDHNEITLTEQAFNLQLEDALNSLDQPTFDAINTYFVSRAVREAGLTVALAGTGGDELLGGYESFSDLPRVKRFTRYTAALPAGLRHVLAELLYGVTNRAAGEVRQQVRWGKIKDLIAAQGELQPLYQVSYALFSRDFLNTLSLKPLPQEFWGLGRNGSSIIDSNESLAEQITRLELDSFLGERLLPDTDAASMAVSLEVRVPLLDHEFIESLQQVNASQRYQPMGAKQLLRSFVDDQIDTSVFDRPKAGFELPMEKWCKNSIAPEMESAFRDINLLHAVGLNAESVSRLWRAFKADAPGLYWSRIWSIYVLLNWCRKHGVFLK